MIKQISQIAEKVKADDLGKKDFTVQSQDIMIRKDGIFAMDGKLLNLNDHALSQFSQKIGVPTIYAKKCMEENPVLFADHANYWLNQEGLRNKDLLIRTKGDIVRAVLSDRYSTLDNNYVLETLERILGADYSVDVKNFSLDPKFFNLRLVFDNMNMNIGTKQNPDNIMVGIHVTNSEVGSSSLRIDSCLYRLVCSNGLIARVGGNSLLAQRHSNLTDSEMQNRVSKAIVEAVKLGDKTVDRFASLKDIAVKDPLEEIKSLAEQEKYSEKFTDDLLLSYQTEREFTKEDSAFTLVNAFTRSAQNMPTFERRLEVETFAGKLVEGYLK